MTSFHVYSVSMTAYCSCQRDYYRLGICQAKVRTRSNVSVVSLRKKPTKRSLKLSLSYISINACFVIELTIFLSINDVKTACFQNVLLRFLGIISRFDKYFAQSLKCNLETNMLVVYRCNPFQQVNSNQITIRQSSSYSPLPDH